VTTIKKAFTIDTEPVMFFEVVKDWSYSVKSEKAREGATERVLLTIRSVRGVRLAFVSPASSSEWKTLLVKGSVTFRMQGPPPFVKDRVYVPSELVVADPDPTLHFAKTAPLAIALPTAAVPLITKVPPDVLEGPPPLLTVVLLAPPPPPPHPASNKSEIESKTLRITNSQTNNLSITITVKLTY